MAEAKKTKARSLTQMCKQLEVATNGLERRLNLYGQDNLDKTFAHLFKIRDLTQELIAAHHMAEGFKMGQKVAAHMVAKKAAPAKKAAKAK